MILITTAGKVGSEAARLLAQRGTPVRVLSRHPEKAAALAQLGVVVAEGDLDDPASIDAAMRGVESIVLVSPAIHAVSLIAEGDAAWLSEDVPTVLGRRARSFAQFVTDHAAAFSSAA